MGVWTLIWALDRPLIILGKVAPQGALRTQFPGEQIPPLFLREHGHRTFQPLLRLWLLLINLMRV